MSLSGLLSFLSFHDLTWAQQPLTGCPCCMATELQAASATKVCLFDSLCRGTSWERENNLSWTSSHRCLTHFIHTKTVSFMDPWDKSLFRLVSLAPSASFPVGTQETLRAQEHESVALELEKYLVSTSSVFCKPYANKRTRRTMSLKTRRLNKQGS